MLEVRRKVIFGYFKVSFSQSWSKQSLLYIWDVFVWEWTIAAMRSWWEVVWSRILVEPQAKGQFNWRSNVIPTCTLSSFIDSANSNLSSVCRNCRTACTHCGWIIRSCGKSMRFNLGENRIPQHTHTHAAVHCSVTCNQESLCCNAVRASEVRLAVGVAEGTGLLPCDFLFLATSITPLLFHADASRCTCVTFYKVKEWKRKARVSGRFSWSLQIRGWTKLPMLLLFFWTKTATTACKYPDRSVTGTFQSRRSIVFA